MRTEQRPGPSTRVRVVEWQGARRTEHEDRLATEEPLALRLCWPGRAAQQFVVTMRTPGHDFELAAGIAHGQGLIDTAETLRTVSYCTDDRAGGQTSPGQTYNGQTYNVVTITLDRPPAADVTPRSTIMSAACGVCGQETLDTVSALGGVVLPPMPLLSRRVVTGLPALLREQQRVFGTTGGLHAAGLFEPDGTPLVVREDVGRHNAVDKVIGNRLLGGSSAAGLVLAVSGRVGYEIVQKAVLAGVVAVVAVGAPSSLAVDLARRFGLTIAGWVRGERMVLHSTPERVIETS